MHSSAAVTCASATQPNKILQRAPPRISGEEKRLPRHYRATLSQLRSSYCAKMLDYRKRIGLTTTDLCPECELATHTVQHLFNCQSHPTSLTTEEMWTRPTEVAAHISPMTAFADLPALEPPVPPPPPEPPPTPTVAGLDPA